MKQQEPIRLFLWTVVDDVTELSEAEVTLRVGAERPRYIGLGGETQMSKFLQDPRNADRYVKLPELQIAPNAADSPTAALIREQVDLGVWDERPGPDVAGPDGSMAKGNTVLEILAGIFDALPQRKAAGMATQLLNLRAVVSRQHELINAQQHLLESDRIGEEPHDFDDTSG